MANSVGQDRQGPIWVLGNIVVAAAGTPVSIMNLVDAAQVNNPNALTSATSDEYTVRAQQIIFQGYKAGAGPPSLTNNTGNVYILKKGSGGGTGNATDKGVIVAVIAPGQTFTLGSAALNRNVFSPYEFFVDADNTGDSVQVSLVIQ
jgi:hypothetical protein